MADILYYGITVNDGVGHQPVYMKDMPTEGIAIARELSPKASLFVDSLSPDGFNWGRIGFGTSQLGLALLLDVTGEAELARKYVTLFTETFLLTLPNTWAMTASQIRRFVEFNEVNERLTNELGMSSTRAKEKILEVFGGQEALRSFIIEIVQFQGEAVAEGDFALTGYTLTVDALVAVFTLAVDIGLRIGNAEYRDVTP